SLSVQWGQSLPRGPDEPGPPAEASLALRGGPGAGPFCDPLFCPSDDDRGGHRGLLGFFGDPTPTTNEFTKMDTALQIAVISPINRLRPAGHGGASDGSRGHHSQAARAQRNLAPNVGGCRTR